jgi:hypothetical protein
MLVFGITLSERAMTDGLSVLYQELLSAAMIAWIASF